VSVYYHDYPTKKIGRGNPYSQCVFCGRSDPDINGRLERHNDYCLYRRAKEAIIAGGSTAVWDELAEMEEDVDRYFHETRPLLKALEAAMGVTSDPD
jgi:hypothetical protein